MKIVIPGGSGHVGTLLAQAFHADGHQIVVLSRTPTPAPWRVVVWDAQTLGPWAAEIDGADAVINLAGRSVNCRYHAANRQAILDSRALSTRAVGQAIAQAKRPPRAWLQMSTATIYAHRYDAPNEEITGILGGNEPNAPDTWRFSIDVARAWERAVEEADTPHTRKVLLRTAMVMSPARWRFRRAARSGAAPARWAGRRRPAVRLVDSSRGFRAGDPLAPRSRRAGRPGEHRVAGAAAERRFHAGAAAGMGRPPRAAGISLDVGDRRFFPAHGDGTGAQKPPGGSGPVVAIGVHVPVSALARGRRRAMWGLA